jgi:hypothetical protein
MTSQTLPWFQKFIFIISVHLVESGNWFIEPRQSVWIRVHGRTGKKKLGGRKEICPTQFRIVPALSKKFSGETFQNCCWRGGGGGGSGYEKFLLDNIFPTKLTEFPTKLTEFVPFIFVISQYCPLWSEYCPTGFVCPTNWGAAAPSAIPPPPGTPMLGSEILTLSPDWMIVLQLSDWFK